VSIDTKEILKAVDTVLVIDWPSKDVPDALALAGFKVVVKGGPGPEDYFAHEMKNGKAESRRVGRPPERADLVYSYRPLSELPGIIALAKKIHARAIWTQSGFSAEGKKDLKGCWLPENERSSARKLVESSELKYVSEPYIGDVARGLFASRRTPTHF